jgi:hypothetical protein
LEYSADPLAMNHHIETLLSQIKRLLAQLKQLGGDDLQTANAETCGLVRELKHAAVQLVQINTNSLSRATREEISSTLVASAPFLVGPEEIGTIQEFERQQAGLNQELTNASTRAARRGPTSKLRHLDQQRMLFLRRILNCDGKPRRKLNLKRNRKSYFRAMRALGINTQGNACNYPEAQ